MNPSAACLKILALSTCVWLMAACTSQNVQEKTTEQPRNSGINLQNMDTLVKPGNNFTRYVNGNWERSTQIPADKAAYGAFHILRDKSQDDVKAIIESSATGKFDDGSEEQKIGDFYEAYMNMNRRDSIGLAPLAPEMQKIAAIKNYTDLANYFAYANKMNNMVPFNIGVETDFKDPRQYMLYTWQGGLGLPEREYYFLNDAKSAEIRKKYVSHIENMFKLAGIEGGKEKAKKIMELETALASKHMKKEQTRDMVAIYNKVRCKRSNYADA
jgi:putative endopeptidase